MTRGLDLNRVRIAGKRLRGSMLELHAIPSTATPLRVGIVVPRHSHTAVDRNRIKRQLREIVRTETLGLLRFGEVVVYAMPSAYRASFSALKDDLRALWRRITP